VIVDNAEEIIGPPNVCGLAASLGLRPVANHFDC
jgi:hypothetical protein